LRDTIRQKSQQTDFTGGVDASDVDAFVAVVFACSLSLSLLASSRDCRASACTPTEWLMARKNRMRLRVYKRRRHSVLHNLSFWRRAVDWLSLSDNECLVPFAIFTNARKSYRPLCLIEPLFDVV